MVSYVLHRIKRITFCFLGNWNTFERFTFCCCCECHIEAGIWLLGIRHRRSDTV